MTKVRPTLLLIDKGKDTLETIKLALRKKFELAKEAHIKRLLLSTGEIIDNVNLIERNDRIQIELRLVRSERSKTVAVQEQE